MIRAAPQMKGLFSRLLGRACAIGCLTAVIASPARAPDATAGPYTATAALDSAATLRSAQHSLRFFHTSITNYFNTLNRFPTLFKCEKIVMPYCYGPQNGGAPLGAPGAAIPVLFRTMPSLVDKGLRTRVNYTVSVLLRDLDAAQKKLPGDRWIAGQRVFQRVQHGEMDAALEVARSCRSEKWWCASLVGFVSTLLDQQLRADSAFTVALNALAPTERCKWEDATDLLHDDKEKLWYTGLTCAEKREANEILWWLADPLYLTPGNERRSAHYFRAVFSKVFFDSNERLPVPLLASRRRPNPAADLQNPGLRVAAWPAVTYVYEMHVWNHGALRSVVRSVGVPSFFILEGNPWDTPNEPTVLLQYPQPTYHFIPNLSAVRDPMSATADDWDLHDSRALERYHPRYGSFESVDYQTAFFRRGDSARLVVAADIAGSTLLPDSGSSLVTAAVVLSRGPNDLRTLRDSIHGTRTTFNSLVPAESALVSVEAVIAGVGALRARLAIGPPVMPRQRVSVSDILLARYDNTDVLPGTLDSAARIALPRTSLAEGSSAIVFWELYGIAAGDSVTYAISATELATSTLTRLGRLLGVTRREVDTRTSWSELVSGADNVEERSIALDLTALRRGRYRLALEVQVKGQLPIHVAREITIIRP